VSDIGSQTGWLKAASHDARNLYVSGPMGLATSVALGLAAVRPNEQVLAIAGDGALAMNLTSLATIVGCEAEEPLDPAGRQSRLRIHGVGADANA
jgi:sulfopyruvate decarboxylase subunit beta